MHICASRHDRKESLGLVASLQILLGLMCLGLGGDALVRGAVGIAQKLKISPLVTGLVLVGFGTSTPELATSVNAVINGAPGIAVGNVIGSNVANVLLILGVTAAIYPIATQPAVFKRDAPVLAIATLVFVALAFQGEFGRLSGVAFVTLLLAYIGFTYVTDRKAQDAQAEIHIAEAGLIAPAAKTLWISTLIAVAGVALVILGANTIVAGSVSIARIFGISEAIIGLTIVAIGTSLPELAASVAAAFRKQTDIALGNIIGSNIFNILAIIGVTSLIKPIAIPQNVVSYDLWILLIATALLFLAAFTDARLSRREGVVFLGLYVAYIVFLSVRATGAM